MSTNSRDEGRPPDRRQGAQERDLLVEWNSSVEHTELAHSIAASVYSRRHYWLGVPTVVLSAIVGTLVFATLGQAQVSALWEVLTGLLSISAAVLAALQTFLSYSDRAAKHARAAHEFAAIQREIEQLLYLETHVANSPDQDEVTRIREQMTRAGENAPNIPDFVWPKLENVETSRRRVVRGK